jgi:hypothetical protein
MKNKQRLRDLIMQMNGIVVDQCVMNHGQRGIWVPEQMWDKLIELVKEITKVD